MASKKETVLCGMAGEFLVAGQLLKRGHLACVTLGNAKAIDLLVHNDKTGKDFHVQVKTMRNRNAGWFMQQADRKNIYVFVILNGENGQEEYFVIKGETICNEPERFFGAGYKAEAPASFDGISLGSVKDFQDKWEVFAE